jgi:hypothetical protein
VIAVMLLAAKFTMNGIPGFSLLPEAEFVAACDCDLCITHSSFGGLSIWRQSGDQ